MKILAGSTLAVLAAVGMGGFFHGAGTSAPPSAPPAVACEAPGARPAGLLARVESPDYRREADLSLRVADCVKAEDELEAKLEKVRGEILDMDMEGTEGSRRCVLRVLVPSPSFRAFVGELRGMGKIQSEKITASKLKAGAAAEEVDPRELCRVSIRMADEKVARAVLESRGRLAASFDRSASHLMKGVAVLVEGVGYVLPFGLAAAAVLVPALLLRRLRRAR